MLGKNDFEKRYEQLNQANNNGALFVINSVLQDMASGESADSIKRGLLDLKEYIENDNKRIDALLSKLN